MKSTILILLSLLIVFLNYKIFAKKPSSLDGIRLALWVDAWLLMAFAGYMLAKG